MREQLWVSEEVFSSDRRPSLLVPRDGSFLRRGFRAFVPLDVLLTHQRVDHAVEDPALSTLGSRLFPAHCAMTRFLPPVRASWNMLSRRNTSSLQVARPLDFSTIRKRQQKGRYAKHGMSKLWEDISTVYRNAKLYNQACSRSLAPSMSATHRTRQCLSPPARREAVVLPVIDARGRRALLPWARWQSRRCGRGVL